MATEVPLLAANGFHPARAHPHGQQWEMWSGAQPSHVLGRKGLHRGTTSFWGALGGSPRWAFFLTGCICDPVVFVRIKQPPASWVQTKGRSPLVMPACAGGLMWTWWTLSVLSSLVLWIPWVCQSPEPIDPWEASTDLSSFPSLQHLGFLLPISP